MDVTLSGNGQDFARISNVTIFGKKTLGGYRLTFVFRGRIPERRGTAMIMEHLGCRWYVKDVDAMVLIGDLVADAPAVHQRFPHSQESQFILNADLSSAEFNRLETARNGGDLTLRFEFFGLIRIESGLFSLSGHSVADEIIPQSQWLDILRKTGISDYWLLEVPMPGNLTDPEMKAAADCLLKAQESFFRGQFDQAVAHCRGVWERIANKHGSQPSTTNTHHQSKSDKWTVVRGGLLQLTHLAHHQKGVAANTAFDRADAIAAIGAAASLMHLYS